MNTMPWKTKAPAANPMADPLQGKIDMLGKVKAELGPLKKLEKKLVDELGAALGAGDHNGTKCTLHVSESEAGERFDAKAFQEMHPDIAAMFMVPKDPVKTLTIKALV